MRYSAIRMAMKSEEGSLIQTEMAAGLGLDVGYWDRVMSYLTEITYIINKSYRSENETASGKNNNNNNEERNEKISEEKNPNEGKESSKKNEGEEEKHLEEDLCNQEKQIDKNKPEVREDVNKEVGNDEDASVLSMLDGQSIKNLTIN